MKRFTLITIATLLALAAVAVTALAMEAEPAVAVAPQLDVAQADLVITKTVSPATDVTLGIDVLYTIEFANHGDAAAIAVVVSDTLPSAVEFGGWVDQGSAMLPDPQGNIVTWGPHDVAVGESHSFAFTATLKSLTAFYSVSNEACVKESADPDWADCDIAVFEMGGYRIYMPLVMKNAGTLITPTR
jgi:uncharacterized repeat protein (TIGR01451 family)